MVSEKEKMALRLRRQDLTDREIGRVMRLSREQVNRLRSSARRKIEDLLKFCASDEFDELKSLLN